MNQGALTARDALRATLGALTLISAVGCAPDGPEPGVPPTFEATHGALGQGQAQRAPRSTLLPSGAAERMLQQACLPWRSVKGDWLSHGYGLALHASGDEFVIYDVSEHSCFEEFRGSLADACQPILNVDLGSAEEPSRAVLEASVFGPLMRVRDSGTVRYSFTRTPALPAPCRAGGTPPSADPVQNFDLFWEHMNEHYAFFRLHGVDWRAAQARYRPMVTAATTEDELFRIMSEMLEPLRDYHVSLASETQRFSRPPPRDISENIDGINAYLSENYLFAAGVTMTGNGRVFYRQLSADVGYVLILGMEGYADADVLRTSEDAVRSEIELAGRAVDEAIAALSAATSLIVDVRFNSGGEDAVSLALAGRFADRTRLAWSKVARSGEGYTLPELFFVRPLGPTRFAGEVVVLTSQVTLSAAETFVLAMRTLPHVTVLGERTAGAHSDVM
ncbi:MAG: hypothetical protein JWN04_4090, partial [Myxococcaceae bacterium]|nr:hypothetical protein [Myxococcaceae bacterium]